MAVTGNTELAATKQDLISALVQRELAAMAKFAPLITDVSQFAVKGKQSISFPKLSSFVVTNRATTVAGVPQVLTSTVDKLDLDERAYVSWVVDANDEIQTTIEFQSEAIKRASAAHARYFDNAVLTELNLVAGLNINAGAPADITRDNVLEMREFLMTNDANMDAVSLTISPSQESAMLKIAEFTRADIFGTSNIPAGMIGRVYGVPVIVSNLIVGQQAYMFEKEGCAFGFQKGASFDEQKAIEYGTGAMLNAVDQLFGVRGLQLGEKSLAATESPLVAKLAN